MSIGARLGPYQVLAPLGVGGMGEVYRARDTRLGRDVALEVLPDLFAEDPARLARFHREAQLLASLNHPHIAHLHGHEESGNVRALVMELVEGENLAQRIAARARQRRTAFGVILGTGRYMSPEQAAGPSVFDPVKLFETDDTSRAFSL